MLKITVPASSANLGPGFDSIGVAVSLYLTVTDLGPADSWQVDHHISDLPHDATNQIVKSALTIAPALQPRHLQVKSAIPVARGLGSSSAAIVAGLVLANELGALGLSRRKLMQKATNVEGHPDNAVPAVIGGLTISTLVIKPLTPLKLPFPHLALIAFIPHYHLKTSQARAALPDTLPFKEAVKASSVGNALAAALVKGDSQAIGTLVEADRFHEPYRQTLVADLQRLRQIAHAHGVIGTYLSGAGPTVMTLCPPAKVAHLIAHFASAGLNGDVKVLHVDSQGFQVSK